MEEISVLPAKYPWFIAQNPEEDETQGQNQIFFSPGLSHYKRCRIPELVGNHIRGYYHGWVILSSHPNNINWSLWNPVTCKIVNLPPLIHNQGRDFNDIRYCCLSSPPSDTTSVVLFTRTKKCNIVFCRLHSKTLRWTEVKYAKQLRRITGGFDGQLHDLTCCNGKVYALSILYASIFPNQRLVQVDFVVKDNEDRDKVVINLLPILEISCPCTRYDYFTASSLLTGSSCSTQLFNIVTGFKDKMLKTIGVVYVFKLDMTSMTWEEVEDLKDTFYSEKLSNDLSVIHSSAITSSELELESGGNYIHYLTQKGKLVYSYHIKDKTISVASMPFLGPTANVSACPIPQLEFSDSIQQQQQQEKGVERVVKGDEVEFNSKVDPFCVLEMILEFLPVSCFGNESSSSRRLEGDFDDDSKQQQEDKEDKIVSSMMDDVHKIPFHVLEMIMEFSVGVEYLNFRATCKRCHLAAPMIQLNNDKSKRLQNYSLVSPSWLMVFDNLKGIITFTDPMFGDNYYITTPPELICDFQIHCSRYGWLLMLKSIGETQTLVFFNPFTRDIRELPVAPFHLESYCFSAPPTCPDCIVAGFFRTDIYILFIGREPLMWHLFRSNFGSGDILFFRFFTFFGQDLCGLCNQGELDVFHKIGTPDYYLNVIVDLPPTTCCKSLAQHFLVICDQHLLLVIVGEFGESIEVFKPDDDDDGEWEKIDGLGRHTLYISGTSCICVEAKTPHMGNRIYFSRFHCGNDKIVFYSLQTGTYHTFDDQETFPDFFFGTKRSLRPHAWIEPSWS